MNNFIEDGVKNLSRASKLITESMTDHDIEDATLQFAFGIERICKGILYSINPVFIYEDFSYDQTIKEQYAHKLSESGAKNLEKTKARPSVLAMYKSVEKSAQFSDAVSLHKSAFLKLKHYRDILVHRSLDEFEHEKVKLWLFENYYPSSKSIIHEQGLGEQSVYQGREPNLKKYSDSSEYEKSLRIKLGKLLDKHRNIWSSQNNAHFKTEAERITQLEFNQIRDTYDNGNTKHKCPACGQDSVLESEVEIIGDKEDWLIDGPYAVQLRCHYCSLRVDNFELLDCLDVDNWWKQDTSSN